MAWIELHDTLWDHHKTLKVCSKLLISDVQLIGHLVSLWHFTLKNAPNTGDLDAWGDYGIARGARWEDLSQAEKFCDALREAEFLQNRKINDWEEFTLHYIASMERRERGRDKVRKRVNKYRDKLAKDVTLVKRSCNAPVTLEDDTCNASVTECNAATKPNQANPTNPTKPNKQRKRVSGNVLFDSFWTAYPRKVGKGAALAVWEKMDIDPDLHATILSAVNAQSVAGGALNPSDPRFIPHPERWLRNRRFEDEVFVASPTAKPFVEELESTGPNPDFV